MSYKRVASGSTPPGRIMEKRKKLKTILETNDDISDEEFMNAVNISLELKLFDDFSHYFGICLQTLDYWKKGKFLPAQLMRRSIFNSIEKKL